MRIHTRTVFQMTADPTEYKLLEDESYEYDGPVAECIGGGGSSPPSSTTQQAVPWSGVQQNLANLYATASGQRKDMMSKYRDIAKPDYYEQLGQQRLASQAQMGGLQPYAQQGMAHTLQGRYFDHLTGRRQEACLARSPVRGSTLRYGPKQEASSGLRWAEAMSTRRSSGQRSRRCRALSGVRTSTHGWTHRCRTK